MLTHSGFSRNSSFLNSLSPWPILQNSSDSHLEKVYNFLEVCQSLTDSIHLFYFASELFVPCMFSLWDINCYITGEIFHPKVSFSRPYHERAVFLLNIVFKIWLTCRNCTDHMSLAQYNFSEHTCIATILISKWNITRTQPRLAALPVHHYPHSFKATPQVTFAGFKFL